MPLHIHIVLKPQLVGTSDLTRHIPPQVKLTVWLPPTLCPASWASDPTPQHGPASAVRCAPHTVVCPETPFALSPSRPCLLLAERCQGSPSWPPEVSTRRRPACSSFTPAQAHYRYQFKAVSLFSTLKVRCKCMGARDDDIIINMLCSPSPSVLQIKARPIMKEKRKYKSNDPTNDYFRNIFLNGTCRILTNLYLFPLGVQCCPEPGLHPDHRLRPGPEDLTLHAECRRTG